VTDDAAPRTARLRPSAGSSHLSSPSLPAFLATERRSIVVAPQLSVAELDAIAGCTRLQVQLLHNRSIRGAEAVSAFLAGDWRAAGLHLLDLDRAIQRILQAIHGDESIVVFGDYDCDGITSCALLLLALRRLGARVEGHIPARDDDGRGLNAAALDTLADRGVRLVITTDCGTANLHESRLARTLGIDLIVTDHHPPHGPLAEALAIINPARDDEPAPHRDLAGAGVAFRLAEALLGASSLDGEVANAFLASLLDLVAIGTIGDLVPLSLENSALARAGLRQLTTSPRTGVRALLRRAEIDPADVDVQTISFTIAPRLNAAGRLGQPMVAVDLLTTTSAPEAQLLAQRLEALNVERQATAEAIHAAAREQTLGTAADGTGDPHVVIAVGEGWAFGMLGLVAGRLADEFQRPAFVISRGAEECRGSGRAPRGVDLGALLAGRADLFKRFGGHAQAAGFTLATADLDALLAYLRERLSVGVPRSEGGVVQTLDAPPPLQVDCVLPLRRAIALYADVAQLAPFGTGFPEPLFVTPPIRIVGCWRSGPRGRNLRVALREGRTDVVALWSRKGDLAEELRAALPSLPPVEVIYTLSAYRRRVDGTAEVLPRILTLSAAKSSPTGSSDGR
jgi:single-stranded-DNA-specific exonuclease